MFLSYSRDLRQLSEPSKNQPGSQSEKLVTGLSVITGLDEFYVLKSGNNSIKNTLVVLALFDFVGTENHWRSSYKLF